jgi:hypothetical protein
MRDSKCIQQPSVDNKHKQWYRTLTFVHDDGTKILKVGKLPTFSGQLNNITNMDSCAPAVAEWVK